MAKRKQPRREQARDVLGWVWAVIGIVATLGGALTFILFDVPELIQSRRGGSQHIAPAAEGEVLVLVADFTGDETIEADTRIYRALRERVASSHLENVRVERLEGVAPLLAEDASAAGEPYGATLVIWGTADRLGIEPRYQIIRHQDLIRQQADLGITTADETPSFSAYVVEDVPGEFEYLMLFSLGQIAYFTGDYAEARRLFDDALSIDVEPDRASALGMATVYLYRGYAADIEGDHEAAQGDYTQAIAIDPTLSAAYYNRGLLRYRAGAYQDALADYSQAITLNPGVASYYNNRATVYYALGDYEAALQDADQAILLDASLANAYTNRGLIRLTTGNTNGALDDFDRAIELAPDSAPAYNNRGYLHYLEGRLDEALADTSRAIELDPAYAPAYDSRGSANHAMGNLDAALADFSQALELSPRMAVAYYNRARLHEDMGQPAAARADYEQFLALHGVEDDRAAEARARIEALAGSGE